VSPDSPSQHPGEHSLCLIHGVPTVVRRPVRSRAPLSRPTAVLSSDAQLDRQRSGRTPQTGQQSQGTSRGGEQERCGRRQRRQQPSWSVPWTVRRFQAAKAVGVAHAVHADSMLQCMSCAAHTAQQYVCSRLTRMCIDDRNASQQRSRASCRPWERPRLQGHEQHREQERTVLQGVPARAPLLSSR